MTTSWIKNFILGLGQVFISKSNDSIDNKTHLRRPSYLNNEKEEFVPFSFSIDIKSDNDLE
jgi:hypothetical protein